MANLRKTVMISSTALDLPTHRKEAISACQRVDMFPLPMENLPADPSDAVAVSLRMVDQADVYIGIFGHRYGYVPEGATNPSRKWNTTEPSSGAFHVTSF